MNHRLLRDKVIAIYSSNSHRVFFFKGDFPWSVIESTTLEQSEPVQAVDDSLESKGFTVLRYLVANSCNLSCTYCQIQGNRNGDKGQIIGTQAFETSLERFIVEVDPHKMKTVEISGGEPLLNKTAVKMIVNGIRKRQDTSDYRLVLSTNATLVDDDIATFLADNNVLTLVSIDGWKELHDSVRHSADGRGSYNSAIRGYRLLQKHGCGMGVSVVARQENLSLLPEITRFVISNLEPQSFGINYLKCPSLSNIAGIDMSSFADYLYECFRLCRNNGIYLEQIMRKVEPFVEEKQRMFDCSSQGRALNVDYDGSVGPCKSLLVTKDFAIPNGFDSTTLLAETKEFKLFSKRTPFNWQTCEPCIGRSICGGGCAYNAFAKNGNIDSVDTSECSYSKKLIELMIWDLFDMVAAHHRHENVITPDKEEKRLLYGKSVMDSTTMKSSVGHALE